MSRSVARLVALFFLFATGVDLCHPCVEKLECAGLLPDHSQFPLHHSKDCATRHGQKGDEPPASQQAQDDDCLCCRTDVLTESMIVGVSYSEYSVPAFFPQNQQAVDQPVSILTFSHSPPFGDLRLETGFKPSNYGSRRLRKLLSEDLLPPPGLIRQS